MPTVASIGVPAWFVIGDSLPFLLNNVKSGLTGFYLPAASITFEFIEAKTRIQIVTGTMALYDAPTASYNGIIANSSLTLYNSITNPNGIKPRENYILRALIDNNGIKTTKAATLVALLEPPDEEGS